VGVGLRRFNLDLARPRTGPLERVALPVHNDNFFVLDS